MTAININNENLADMAEKASSAIMSLIKSSLENNSKDDEWRNTFLNLLIVVMGYVSGGVLGDMLRTLEENPRGVCMHDGAHIIRDNLLKIADVIERDFTKKEKS